MTPAATDRPGDPGPCQGLSGPMPDGDSAGDRALIASGADGVCAGEPLSATGRAGDSGTGETAGRSPGGRSDGGRDPDPGVRMGGGHAVARMAESRRGDTRGETAQGEQARGGGGAFPAEPAVAEALRAWDDGLIARRAPDAPDTAHHRAAPRPDAGTALWEGGGALAGGPYRISFSRALRQRLEAMRELVGLSRTRVDARALAEASHVLEQAAARHRLSLDHTVVAIAGASGSGKSTLFNALVGAVFSEVGVRRPTTSAPVACTWSEGADGLLDRLGIPPRQRRRPPRLHDWALRGLVLVDLPDHDSAVTGRREQVDRLLGLVDAVVWVVDPEKYADAVLHERYLRPLAGYSEVTFVVLNQIDRLPGEATDQVLDDLRRLLDEDGLALGEHGEPGATVLSVSALTGEGVGELRCRLAEFTGQGRAAEHRVTADVDGAAERLRHVCMAHGRPGLTEQARADFEDRLADAMGAVAAGQAAEREWLRYAELACGVPWAQLRQWHGAKRSLGPAGQAPVAQPRSGTARMSHGAYRPKATAGAKQPPGTDRAMVELAVRTVAQEASVGLPDAWARAVREAAMRGAGRLPDALDQAAEVQAVGTARPSGPGWWSVASALQGLLLVLQVVGGLWLVASVMRGPGEGWLLPALLMAAGVGGGPALAWCCRTAARGPARRYGLETERRLRGAAAACGRERVLEPVAAELLRYREVREQYLIAAGGPTHATLL